MTTFALAELFDKSAELAGQIVQVVGAAPYASHDIVAEILNSRQSLTRELGQRIELIRFDQEVSGAQFSQMFRRLGK